jgi:hypothetical protein
MCGSRRSQVTVLGAVLLTAGMSLAAQQAPAAGGGVAPIEGSER